MDSTFDGPPPGMEFFTIRNDQPVSQPTNVVEEMYIDPETNEIHKCVNGVWNNYGADGLTPKKVPKLVINKSVDNFYCSLSEKILDEIAIERDILIAGTVEEKAEQLRIADQIDPEWVSPIFHQTISTFTALQGYKLHVFAALKKIPLVHLGQNLNMRQFTDYIRAAYFIVNPDHHMSHMLPFIVNTIKKSDKITLDALAVCKGLPEKYVDFVDFTDLVTFVLTGSIKTVDLTKLDARATRYHTYKTHKYRHILGRLYNNERNSKSIWFEVIKRDPDEMENIIVNFDTFGAEAIINLFGICVPQLFVNNIERYVLDNICSYKKILGRGAVDAFPIEVLTTMSDNDLHRYFTQLTDMEIFDIGGVYIPYSSRAELIGNIVQVFTRPGFMCPTRRTHPERWLNTETTMFAEVSDHTIFMVGYGSPARHRMYDLEELLAAFSRDEETGVRDFRRPETLERHFSEQDIYHLEELLDSFPATEEITNLLQAMREILEENRDKLEFDSEIKRRSFVLIPSVRENVKEILHTIFYIGMYMRRWKGPGHPYPLRSTETNAKEDPDEIVLDWLEKLNTQLNNCGNGGKDFVLNFKVCEYNGGTISAGDREFGNYLQGVKLGRTCIRMASTKFIGTAVHFLKVIFKITIPGLDLNELDLIT